MSVEGLRKARRYNKIVIQKSRRLNGLEQGEKHSLWAKSSPLVVFINTFVGGQPCPFMYALPTATFLQDD